MRRAYDISDGFTVLPGQIIFVSNHIVSKLDIYDTYFMLLMLLRLRYFTYVTTLSLRYLCFYINATLLTLFNKNIESLKYLEKYTLN